MFRKYNIFLNIILKNSSMQVNVEKSNSKKKKKKKEPQKSGH